MGKKLLNFFQSKLLFNFTLDYLNVNMLIGKSNQLSLIGNGLNSVNYTFIKNNFDTIIPELVIFKSQKHKNLMLTVQFNKLSVHKKLNSIGFTLTDINFLNTKTSVNTVNNLSKFNNMFLNYQKILSIVITQVITLRSLHTYL